MTEIRLESRRNPRIRLYRGLDRRQAREASGLMAAEGVRLVIEALRSSLEVPELFLSDKLAEDARGAIREALARAARETVVYRVPADVFEAIAHTRNPQGAAALVRIPKESAGELPARFQRLVILHRPQDPGNVGAVARSLEAAGFDALALVEPACDPYSPKAVRASMGSLFRVPVLRWASFEDEAAALVRRGFSIYMAEPRGGRNFYELDVRSPLAIIFGGETSGLPPMGELAAQVFSVPMGGQVESLNLAQVAAVVLFEFRRRQAAP